MRPTRKSQLYFGALLVLIFAVVWAPLLRAETQLFPAGLALNKYGSGEFRRFGFLIYEAVLWAATDPVKPPIALELTYRRAIPGRKIVDASVEQMRDLGANENSLSAWAEAMAAIFPDVSPGDQITGIYRSDSAIFFYNNRPIGQIDDPEFARLFFGIWLDSRTSEPRLRNQLLGQRAG